MSEIVEQISDDIREKSLQYAVDKLAKEKLAKNKISSNSYNYTVEALSQLGIDINIDALYQRVHRAVERMKTPVLPLIGKELEIESTTDTHISTLTCSDASAASSPSKGTLNKAGGRPKGTTKKIKRENSERYKKCLQEVTQKYSKALAR